MLFKSVLSALGLATIVLYFPTSTALAADAPKAISGEAGTQPVQAVNVEVRGNAVTGTLINNSSNAVKEVKLMIRQAWLWNDERKPGDDDPGRSFSYSVMETVPANGNRAFTVQLPPAPERNDGHFVTTAEVMSYTEVSFTP